MGVTRAWPDRQSGRVAAVARALRWWQNPGQRSQAEIGLRRRGLFDIVKPRRGLPGLGRAAVSGALATAVESPAVPTACERRVFRSLIAAASLKLTIDVNGYTTGWCLPQPDRCGLIEAVEIADSKSQEARRVFRSLIAAASLKRRRRDVLPEVAAGLPQPDRCGLIEANPIPYSGNTPPVSLPQPDRCGLIEAEEQAAPANASAGSSAA